jgi:NADH-quinone oxidoreductase subunit J
MEAVAFWILAFLCIGSAMFVVLGRNAVVCGLALAFNLVTIAGFFLLLDARFLAFVQVMVYAGAIMVLILFVLMLLNIQEERQRAPRNFQRVFGFLFALAFLASMFATLRAGGAGAFPAKGAGFGTVQALGQELFTTYFYPFEAISILLLVAMVGAVLLAKKRL